MKFVHVDIGKQVYMGILILGVYVYMEILNLGVHVYIFICVYVHIFTCVHCISLKQCTVQSCFPLKP